jgi:exo-beta-1,3-glucanase (GH17 family)
VETLEERTLMSGGAPPLLTSTRAWILYSPSSQVAPSPSNPTPAFNPDANAYPTDAQITADLQKLVSEGWKGIVTYSLLSTLGDVPRIASGLGLHVIAGLYYLKSPLNTGNEAALAAQEITNAVAAQNYVDGYVVGNEGLLRAKSGGKAQYQLADVTATILDLQAQKVNKPMTTTEPSEFYLNGGPYSNPGALRDTGDWEFPNDNFYDGVRRPADAYVQAENNYFGIIDQSKPGRTVVIKESFWPTAGTYQDGTPLTQQDQATYFQDLATQTVRSGSTVYFTWGEAYDQYWKVDPPNQGPNWGFHLSGANYPTAKLVITQLQSTYTADYAPPHAPANLLYASGLVVIPEFMTIIPEQPTSSGGAVVSYTISPALPPGLFLSGTTGDIFGTPTVDSPPTQYTVTATNSAGSTTAALTLAVEDQVQRFVAQVYRDLLHREAEPGGLAGWSALLDQGVSRFQVVLAIENSLEYRIDQIEDLYGRFLHRAADPLGLLGWVAFLQTGATVEQVARGIVASPEYFLVRGGGTDEGFLAALYQDALQRPVDPLGWASWGPLLALGQALPIPALMRDGIARLVLASPEYQADQLEHYYQAFLGRPPEQPALGGWEQAIHLGVRDELIIACIEASAEKASRI